MQIRFKWLCLLALVTSTLLPAASIHADDGKAPSIPASLTAHAISSSSIELTWAGSYDADGIKHYNVYRDGRYHAATDSPYFIDRNLPPDSRYYYWIVALDNTDRASSTSRWAFARTRSAGDAATVASGSRPAAPNEVRAVLNPSGAVEISWSVTGESGDIGGYNIYRNNRYIQTVKAPPYVDNTSERSANDEYSVVAYSPAKKFSPHSTVARVQSNPKPPPPQTTEAGRPAIPAGLSSTVHSGSCLTLNWSRVDTARGYNVYRDDAYVKTVWQEAFDDAGLSSAQTYRYSIVAFDEQKRFSRHSSEHAVTTGSDRSRTALDISEERSSATRSAITGDYYLAFSDEFNTGGLDLEKWNTAYLWGPDVTTNNESQYYVDIANEPDYGYQPFSGNGSSLAIKADKTPDWLKDRANGKPYLSGVMTSYDAFQFTYGYAEARLRAPRGNGFFSAFWLLNARYVDIRPEIDIAELLGESPNVVYHTYHYTDAAGNLVSSDTFDTSLDDFSNEFHTYAVRWSPGELIWYVDGKEARRLAHDNISAQPMYLLFNVAIDGNWPQSPDENTVFPSAMEIDYVRVYRK